MVIAELGVGFGIWIVGIATTIALFLIAAIPLHPFIWFMGGQASMTDITGWNMMAGAIHFFLHSLHPFLWILTLPVTFWIYSWIFHLTLQKTAPVVALNFLLVYAMTFVIDLATGFGLASMVFRFM